MGHATVVRRTRGRSVNPGAHTRRVIGRSVRRSKRRGGGDPPPWSEIAKEAAKAVSGTVDNATTFVTNNAPSFLKDGASVVGKGVKAGVEGMKKLGESPSVREVYDTTSEWVGNASKSAYKNVNQALYSALTSQHRPLVPPTVESAVPEAPPSWTIDTKEWQVPAARPGLNEVVPPSPSSQSPCFQKLFQSPHDRLRAKQNATNLDATVWTLFDVNKYTPACTLPAYDTDVFQLFGYRREKTTVPRECYNYHLVFYVRAQPALITYRDVLVPIIIDKDGASPPPLYFLAASGDYGTKNFHHVSHLFNKMCAGMSEEDRENAKFWEDGEVYGNQDNLVVRPTVRCIGPKVLKEMLERADTGDNRVVFLQVDISTFSVAVTAALDKQRIRNAHLLHPELYNRKNAGGHKPADSPYAVCETLEHVTERVKIALHTPLPSTLILIPISPTIPGQFNNNSTLFQVSTNVLTALINAAQKACNESYEGASTRHQVLIPVDNPACDPCQKLETTPPPRQESVLYERLPLARTLPGICYYALSDDFCHEVLGKQFFCLADLSHKKQDVDGKPLTEVTAKDPYTRDTDELFYERLYYVGNEEYCKGVMSTITQELATIKGGLSMGTSLARGLGLRRGGRTVRRRHRKVQTKRPGARRLHTRRALRRTRRPARGGVAKMVKSMLGKMATDSLIGTGKDLVQSELKKATTNPLGVLGSAGMGALGLAGSAGSGALSTALSAATGTVTGSAATTASALASGTELGRSVLANLPAALGLGTTVFGTGMLGASTVANQVLRKNPVSMALGLMFKGQLDKYLAIQPYEHQQVWGNQLQDYLCYKGVHVGLPTEMYQEMLDYPATSKRYLVYYIKFELEDTLHPNLERTLTANTKEDNQKHTQREEEWHAQRKQEWLAQSEQNTEENMPKQVYKYATTADFVPFVLKYDRSLVAETTTSATNVGQRLVEGAVSQVRTMASFLGGKAEDGDDVGATVNKLTNFIRDKGFPVQKYIETHTSYVTAPVRGTSDTLMADQQASRFDSLNRLAGASGGVLTQETLLHSLSTLNNRRADLYFANNFVKDKLPERLKTIVNVFAGLLATSATKSLGTRTGLGTVLNMFTGGMGASALSVGMGMKQVENQQGVGALCHLVQRAIRFILPPVVYLFPWTVVNNGDEHFASSVEGGLTGVSDLHNLINPFQNLNNFVHTREAGVPVRALLRDPRTKGDKYRGVRMFFEQFSHNWKPLLSSINADTQCHFVCTEALDRQCGVTGYGPGVALAFEAGASYRNKTIGELVKEAVAAEGTPEEAAKYGQLRTMLFGKLPEVSIDYELAVVHEMLKAWLDPDENTTTCWYVDPPSSTDATGKRTTTSATLGDSLKWYMDKTIEVATSNVATVKNVGGASRYAPNKSKRYVGVAELDEEDLDHGLRPERLRSASKPTEPAPKKTGPRPNAWADAQIREFRSKGDVEMEKDLRARTIALLLQSMANRCIKNDKDVGGKHLLKLTIAELLRKRYKDVFPHTYVVAVVPFRTKAPEPTQNFHRCMFEYTIDKRRDCGPYVFHSKKDFNAFFGSRSFPTFMKNVYSPAIFFGTKKTPFTLTINNEEVPFVKEKFCKDFFDMEREPMHFDRFNRYPFELFEPTDDAHIQFENDFKQYEKYAERIRNTRANEYTEAEREMHRKRKDMLVASQMHALANRQRRLFNGELTPGSVYGYPQDPWVTRRRRRNRRSYRRDAPSDDSRYDDDEDDDSYDNDSLGEESVAALDRSKKRGRRSFRGPRR